METFRNGLIFSEDDFGGGGGAGADSTMGLVGIGGGVIGETMDIGAVVAPTFLLTFISNSPTYQNKSKIRSMTRLKILNNEQDNSTSPLLSAQQFQSHHKSLILNPDHKKNGRGTKSTKKQNMKYSFRLQLISLSE